MVVRRSDTVLRKMMPRVNGTSEASVSRWTPLTLGAVGEVGAIAQCPWRAGVGRRVGFGGTGGAHKSVEIRTDWCLLKVCTLQLRIQRAH